MSSGVLEQVEVAGTQAALGDGDGDHDRFSHYVSTWRLARSGMVVALCGKAWRPRRDPGRFPVCPRCKEVYDGLDE